MKDVGEERKGRSWDKPFWHMHTMMGFPWIDVAVCPNEQREYTGSHCSKLLIWPHVCMCVRVNVSLSVTCLCFCLQVESMDARNACWQKWMYMWDRMREIERVRAVRSHTDMNKGSSYESELPPFFHSFIPHVQLPPPLFHLFFSSIPYLHLSLMLFRQPSFVSELCVTKRRDWVCSCHERMSLSPSLLCPFFLAWYSIQQIDLFVFWQTYCGLCHSSGSGNLLNSLTESRDQLEVPRSFKMKPIFVMLALGKKKDFKCCMRDI